MKAILRFLNDRPWLYVVALFLLLIAAYATLITITARNTPERIDVNAPPAAAQPAANPEEP